MEHGGVSGLSLFHDYIKSFLRQLGPRNPFSHSHWLPNAAWKVWRELVLLKVTQLESPSDGSYLNLMESSFGALSVARCYPL